MLIIAKINTVTGDTSGSESRSTHAPCGKSVSALNSSILPESLISLSIAKNQVLISADIAAQNIRILPIAPVNLMFSVKLTDSNIPALSRGI